MQINIQGWIFDIDATKTSEYSEELRLDHCECGYCKNYYMSVCGTYPALPAFLSDFCVHVESPVDFLPVEPTLCIVSYAVCGRIVKQGNRPIVLNNLTVLVQNVDELDYTLSCSSSYFVLTTSALELPWLLDEDMNEVVSPANEPECLDRMWRRLLNYADIDVYKS